MGSSHPAPVKLYAISDLHLRYPANLQALRALPPRPQDWLIVAGDVGETVEHLALAFRELVPRFAKVIWVPGNHELWTMPNDRTGPRGEARYQMLVEVCRDFGVLTPEDPYPLWTGEGGPCVIAPLFLLYDYSFHPDDVRDENAIAWALEERILCTDEALLHPDPHPTRQAWCAARVADAEARLSALPEGTTTVLVNHWPLRRELAVLPAIPRFSIWCGTRLTEDWHLRFHAKAVVYGHLHIRRTRLIDGVRFEEVSLGHPGQWLAERGLEGHLREILPGPKAA
jgi:3',5'-cyclic AMP phosphodiesterase CpdA